MKLLGVFGIELLFCSFIFLQVVKGESGSGEGSAEGSGNGQHAVEAVKQKTGISKLMFLSSKFCYGNAIKSSNRSYNTSFFMCLACMECWLPHKNFSKY